MSTWRIGSTVAIAIILSWVVCLSGSCQPAQTEAETAFDQLVADLALLESVNRLDLQKAQLQPLSDLVARVAAEKEKLQPARQAALAQLIPALREKRALLLADKSVPEALDERIQAAQDKLNTADDAIVEAAAGAVPDLKKVLSPEQIAIITGAYEAHAQAQELLEWVREMDAGTFAEEGKANAAELADPDLGLKEDVILKVFSDARKLSAADYTKQRDTFINKLQPLYMPMEEAADSELLGFFSNPRLGVILKDKQG